MEKYRVTGMSCAACSARVEKAVSKVDGVTSCSVSLLTNSMGVEGSATDAQIVEAVEQAGYGASPKGTATESENDKANNSLEQLKAAQDALEGQPAPTPGSITLDRFERVFRTRRDIAAGGREHRRNESAIEPHQ